MLLNRREFVYSILSALLTQNLNLELLNFVQGESKSSIKLPKGIYCVTNTANWVLREGKRIDLFTLDIDGVSNYARWADIEKEQGNYNWIGLDRMLKEAKASNKKIAYHILAGIHTPNWAYSVSRSYPYEYTYKPKYPRKVKTFLPWVEKNGIRTLNIGMLKVWEKTILAFSNYIYNYSEKERIAYVAITGGPTSNGLEIMWGEEYYNEFKFHRWDEETKKIFIEYWERVIDIFIETFPDIPLGLAFTDFFGVKPDGSIQRDYEIPKTIVSYALKKASEKGSVVIPMGLWIGALDPLTFDTHPLIKLLLSFKTPFAIQGPMGTPYERLNNILLFAVSKGALWIELWHHDVIDLKKYSLLKKYRNLLSR